MKNTKTTRTTANPSDFRAILSTGGTGRIPMEEWFDNPEHAEARRFLSTWVEMYRTGDTNWSGVQVAAYLKENFGFPYKPTSSITFRLREMVAKWGKK